MGEGIPLLYELASNDMEKIDFKEVQIGEVETKNIRFLNKSKVPLELELCERAKDELKNNFVEITPKKAVIKPKGFLSIDITFAPQSRVPRYVCEIDARVQGYEPR